MGERTKAWVSTVSCGVILANFVLASSRVFENFSPVPMTSAWLSVAAFACGFILGITLENAWSIFSGTCLMAVIALLIFSAALLWVLGTALWDIVLLFAFQQSFPRFALICALGFSGAVASILLKMWAGQL